MCVDLIPPPPLGRFLFPRFSRSLWCGFAVVGSRERFYFAGDTAYCPVFGLIGERYGPFDLGKDRQAVALQAVFGAAGAAAIAASADTDNAIVKLFRAFEPSLAAAFKNWKTSCAR